MMLRKHLDEARKNAIVSLSDLIKRNRDIERAVLIDDLFGSLRVVVWTKKDAASDQIQKLIDEQIAQVSSPFWTGEVFFASEGTDVDQLFYDSAWEEGRPVDQEDILRVADRYRSRGSWLHAYGNPPWKIVDSNEVRPPIVVFYSFKGGVGRSTALAAFAIQCARAGERVCVVDFDLDAPGIGVLLSADEQGTTSAWGVLDYLLERPHGEVELHDYYHICRREAVTRSGEIHVFPAGKANSGYLGKLARIDFEQPGDGDEPHPLVLLLRQIREELSPDWILIDARAGLSDPAGLLLGGIAHLYVVFGTSSEQSWQGLRLVLGRLGAERVLRDEPQLDCQLVQAMVPEDLKAAKMVTEAFADRAREEFSLNYYSVDPEDPDEDRKWYLRDLDDPLAPHIPYSISYQSWLAHFDIIDDIADKLAKSEEHVALTDQIFKRFNAGGMNGNG